MMVKIVKGEFEGKTAEIIQQTLGIERRLCGGPTTENSVMVLIEGMLHPILLRPSALKLHENVK